MTTTEQIAELFTEQQIADAIGNLPDFSKYVTVAQLAVGEYAPSVITAFAALAKALELPVATESYVGLVIRRLKPARDLRACALDQLIHKRERGEI